MSNQNPNDFIKNNLGKKVLIKLQNEEELKGKLISLDGALNLYLKDCIYLENNIKFKNIFIRGNNGKINIIFNIYINYYLFIYSKLYFSVRIKIIKIFKLKNIINIIILLLI